MKLKFAKAGILALGILSILLLSQCGQPFCVGPFGGNCYSQTAVGGTSTGGGITLTAPTGVSSVLINGTVQFTASGGTGNYTYSIYDAGGLASAGTVSATGLYTAPSSLPTATPVTIGIQVRDSSNQYAYASIVVRAS